VSIQSAIIALSPGVYYPLNESTPNTAVDWSGNLRDATYGLPKPTRITGVETGTYAQVWPSAQACFSKTPTPFAANGNFSFLAYVAVASQNGPANAAFAGNEGVTSASGVTVGLSGAGAYGANSRGNLIRQGTAINSFNADWITDQFWHQIACIYSAPNYSIYRDANLVATIAPGTYTVPNGGGKLVGSVPDPCAMAHWAWWNSAITQANLASVVAAETDRTSPPWVYGQGVINPQIQTDLTSTLSLLNQILAGIKHTFS